MPGVHVRPDEDFARPCRAQSPISCPFTKDGAKHFNTKAEAKIYIAERDGLGQEVISTLNKSKKEYTTPSGKYPDYEYKEELKRNNLRPIYNNKYKMIDVDRLKKGIENLKQQREDNDYYNLTYYTDISTRDKTDEELEKLNSETLDLYERVLNNKVTKVELRNLPSFITYSTPSDKELKYTYGSIIEATTPTTYKRVNTRFGNKKVVVDEESRKVRGRIISDYMTHNVEYYLEKDGQFEPERGDTVSIIDLDNGGEYVVFIDSNDYPVKLISHAPWSKHSINYLNKQNRKKFLKEFKNGDNVYISSNYDYEAKEINGSYTITFVGDSNWFSFANNETGKELQIFSFNELNPLGRYNIVRDENNIINNDPSNYYSKISGYKKIDDESYNDNVTNDMKLQAYNDYIAKKTPYPIYGNPNNNFDDDYIEIEEQQRIETLKNKQNNK